MLNPVGFAIVCMALSTLLGLINLAMGQTDQEANNLSDIAHYNQVISAFSDGCTRAAYNHDSAAMSTCNQIFGLYHDILKPFIDMNKDSMSKVIVGP